MTVIEQEQAFDPFYQAGAAISQRGSNAGLGLVIAREMAELIGATIVVRSALGEGTDFTVTVPA